MARGCSGSPGQPRAGDYRLRPVRQEQGGGVHLSQDTIEALLGTARSLHVQLGSRVHPGQGSSGRRTQPGSRPTIQVDIVSHMTALRDFLRWWNRGAGARLRPLIRVDLTGRQGLKCPWCGGKLVAWLRSADDLEPSEVHCIGEDHDEDDGPAVWTPADWRRLGYLLGTITNASHGPRLPVGMAS